MLQKKHGVAVLRADPPQIPLDHLPHARGKIGRRSARIVAQLVTDHFRRGGGHVTHVAGARVAHDDAVVLPAQAAAVDHHHQLALANEPRRFVPVTNDLPIGGHGFARTDDHPFAAPALRVLRERLERFSLGRKRDLPAEVRDAVDRVTFAGDDDVAARRRERSVQDEMR